MSAAYCNICGQIKGTAHMCIFPTPPIVTAGGPRDFSFEIRISNDNTKHEKTATVTVRSDGDPAEATKLAKQEFSKVFI